MICLVLQYYLSIQFIVDIVSYLVLSYSVLSILVRSVAINRKHGFWVQDLLCVPGATTWQMNLSQIHWSHTKLQWKDIKALFLFIWIPYAPPRRLNKMTILFSSSKVQHFTSCPERWTLVIVTHNISFCQARTASIKLVLFESRQAAAVRKREEKIRTSWTMCKLFGAEMKTCECSRWEAEGRTFLIYMLMRERGHRLRRRAVRRLFMSYLVKA